MMPEFGARVGEAGYEGRVPQPGGLALSVLLGAFGTFGYFAGTFAVLLADLSRALDLSPGPLGFALFVGAAASILAMATLGWTADRLGRRVFLMISGGVMGAGITALAFAGGYAALLAALVVLHAAAGLYDVGINAAAVDLEKATGRRLMAVLHASFSAAGDLAPERAGSAISVVTTLGYGGFLLGPVLVGGLAEVSGLRIALGIIAVSGLLIFALALRLKAP